MPVSIASSVTFGIEFYFWVLHPVACVIKDIRSVGIISKTGNTLLHKGTGKPSTV
jgi:hypothetical protein